MPPINPIAVSAGVVAFSVAVAAAIAIYESPEFRRLTEDLRRRILVAMQNTGENPNAYVERDRERDGTADDSAIPSEPVFNRPEDAEGFLLSRGRASHPNGDPGVDADEESRRRQREELLYWNRRRLEEEAKRQQPNRTTTGVSPLAQDGLRDTLASLRRAAGTTLSSFGFDAQRQSDPTTPPPRPPKTSFDAMLQPDRSGIHGAFVVHTGADTGATTAQDGLARRRGWGATSVATSAAIPMAATAASYANPFADEFGIEMDEQGASTPRGRSPQRSSSMASNSRGADTATAFNSEAYLAPERDDNTASASGHGNNDNSHRLNMDAVFDALPALSAPAAPASVMSLSSGTESLGLERGVRVCRDDGDVDIDDWGLQSTTVGNGREADVFSSIQAWAQQAGAQQVGAQQAGAQQAGAQKAGAQTDGPAGSTDTQTLDAYAALPATPALSEPELVSEPSEPGVLTPAESVSTFWGDDAQAVEAVSSHHSRANSAYEVLSMAEDASDRASVLTPTSWSEVGSVVTDNDAAAVHL